MDPLVIILIVSIIIFVISGLLMLYGRAKDYYPPKTCSICGRPTGFFRNKRFKLKDGCMCKQCTLRLAKGFPRAKGSAVSIFMQLLPSKFFAKHSDMNTVADVKKAMRMMDELRDRVGEDRLWEELLRQVRED